MNQTSCPANRWAVVAAPEVAGDTEPDISPAQGSYTAAQLELVDFVSNTRVSGKGCDLPAGYVDAVLKQTWQKRLDQLTKDECKLAMALFKKGRGHGGEVPEEAGSR